MKKIIIFLVLASMLITGCAEEFNEIQYETETELSLNNLKEFNDCLADKGMVIYGAETCPACRNLVELLGGKNAVENLYVECTLNRILCEENKITNYVPEIQINGAIYVGKRTIEDFGKSTGCEI